MATSAAICANALFAHTLFAVETGFYEPSFDCSGIREGRIKRGSVEYKICTDKDLAHADRYLNFLYSILSLDSRAVDAEQVRKDQRKWLKKRNKCPDKDCILELYRNRAAALFATIGEIELSDVEKPIVAERYECAEKHNDAVNLAGCAVRAARAWKKEIESMQKSIVLILEHLDISELVNSYNRFVAEHENSYSLFANTFSTILDTREGTLYYLIIADRYTDMRMLQYSDLFLLRRTLLYLL